MKRLLHGTVVVLFGGFDARPGAVVSFGGPHLLAPLSSLFGIRPGMNVAIFNPPNGFFEAFVPLPEGAALVENAKTGIDVQILFTAKKVDLVEKLTLVVRGMAVTGSVWVCFPAVETALSPSEDFVRLAGLEMGLVDTKKIVVDPSWIALKLQWKPRNPRPEIPSARA